MNRIKQTILVLEPDEGLRESLGLILEADYQLSFAGDIDKAQKCLTAHDISLFIIEIKGDGP